MTRRRRSLGLTAAVVLGATLGCAGLEDRVPQRPHVSARDLWGDDLPTKLPSRRFELPEGAPDDWLESGGAGRFDAARILAEQGRVDEAFYWLQEAALHDGLDTHAVATYRSFDDVSTDHDRWESLKGFALYAEAYWMGQDLPDVVVLAEEPGPVLVWMHGFASEPGWQVEHHLADLGREAGLSVVGAHGTWPFGPHSYRWAERIDEDHQRVQQALAKLEFEPDTVVLMGFSQGGHVASMLLAAHPEDYAGALILSPGNVFETELDGQGTIPGEARAVVVVAEEEHPGNVALARSIHRHLERRSVQAKLRVTPDQTEHTFPDDFPLRFRVDWLPFLLGRTGN